MLLISVTFIFQGSSSVSYLGLKIVPYGTISGSENFQNSQNSDSQNPRLVILGGFYQILSCENPSSGYFENY
jgi:hypothetical protein